MRKLQNHKKHKSINSSVVFKTFSVAAVFIYIAMLIAPAFVGKVFAFGQVTSRSIEMSSAIASATVVSYNVQFTTTSSIQDIIIDFCPDSPIINDTCSGMPGFSVSSAGLTTGTGTSGWTIVSATAQHIEIKGTATTGAVSFTLTNINNPNATGTFYGRIYDYTSTTTGYSGTNSTGSVADFGGIALSTSAAIGVTARVQEEITFCVAGVSITNDCANAGTNPPNITIGHGSPTLILDSTAVDTATAYTQLSTNAQGGVMIRMKNNNSCGGLSNDNGATCNIPPVGASAATLTAGTADFGLNVADGTGGSGTVNAVAPYSTATEYAMDNTSAPDNVTSTYGSEIAASSGGCSNVGNALTFAATASNTTAAGIYTASMDLIATGTY